MFLGVLNTVFLNITNYLPHLELRNGSIQTVIVMNFVVISNIGIKRFDCIFNNTAQNIDCGSLLEPLHLGSSNCYQQSVFGATIRKIS